MLYVFSLIGAYVLGAITMIIIIAGDDKDE